MRKSKMLAIALFSVIAFIIAGCDLQSILSELNEEDDSKSTSNTVTITYVTELGNVPSPFTNTKNKGDQLKRADLPELEHDGFIFEGWYYQGDLVRAGNFRVYADLTLTAKWSKAATQPEPEPEEENDSGYIGTKAPDEPKKRGDIVFIDGSAISYEDGLTLSKKQKASAIALIFAEERVDLYEGTYLLGLGFERGESLEWCLSSANAFDYCCDYIKEETVYMTKSGNPIYSITDAKAQIGYGYIVFEKTGELLSAEDSGTVDDTDIAENYPAFYFCKNYKETATILKGTDYEDGWYLPSINELGIIYNLDNYHPNFGYDEIFQLCGFKPFFIKDEDNPYSYRQYWAAEPWGAFYSRSCTRSYGNTGKRQRDSKNTVCAIRPFSRKVRYETEFCSYDLNLQYNCIGRIVPDNSILTAEQVPDLSSVQGYTFEGWYDGETKVEAGKYKVTKEVTLVAKWTKNE